MFGINIIYEDSLSSYSIEEIKKLLSYNSFEEFSDNLFICRKEGMTNLYLAIQFLKEEKELAKAIRSIHAFRIKDLSDFTEIVKE